MGPELWAAIEGSWLGALMRASPWLYPIANVLHVLGAACLVGAILVVDLRLMRGSRDLGRPTLATGVKVASAGLLLLLVTGPLLFSTEARALAANPVFQVKMALVALGLVNLLLLRVVLARAASPVSARIMGGVSAAAWVLALVSGRLIAYA